MQSMVSPHEYNRYYQEQTVLLTGGTGGLGTCILYKLSVELPSKKIYVLVRSKEKAIQTWRRFIPNQIGDILNSGRVILVTGDMTKENLGIEKQILAEITSETTLFINSAANTSWLTSLAQAVVDNCFSALEAAAVASTFKQLECFIHISSAFCNSFLPEASVSETMHSFYDPEIELRNICMDGTTPHASRFPWRYAHSKHLSEQLLTSRFPDLPILMVRPSSIGSAVRSPHPAYGPVKATPGEMFWRMHALQPGNGIFHAAHGSKTGTNICDEVPVDWVTNLLLLHAAQGTRGIVHTTAAMFIPRTLDENVELYRENSDSKIVWTSDRSVKQCPTPAFYKVMNRDWHFETGKSEWCKNVVGPLSVDIRGVDLPVYDMARRRKVRMDIAIQLEKRRMKARTRAVMSDTLIGREGIVQRESKL